MGEIVWPHNREATVDMLKDKVSDHHAVLYGNGKDGVLDFIAGLQGQMRLILLLLAVITAISGLAMVVVTVEIAHRSSLDPAKLFHSRGSTPVLSYSQPQSAGNSAAFTATVR